MAESTLDAATLREMLGETSGGRLAERAVTKAIGHKNYSQRGACHELACRRSEILAGSNSKGRYVTLKSTSSFFALCATRPFSLVKAFSIGLKSEEWV